MSETSKRREQIDRETVVNCAGKCGRTAIRYEALRNWWRNHDSSSFLCKECGEKMFHGE